MAKPKARRAKKSHRPMTKARRSAAARKAARTRKAHHATRVRAGRKAARTRKSHRRSGHRKLYGAAAKAHAKRMAKRHQRHAARRHRGSHAMGLPVYTPPSHQLAARNNPRRKKARKAPAKGLGALKRKVSSINTRLHHVETRVRKHDHLLEGAKKLGRSLRSGRR